MKKILLENRDHKIKTTNPKKITRDKYEHKIVNRKEDKDYGFVYTKRFILPDFHTLPYGFIK